MDPTLAGTASVPLIVGLVQAAKMAGLPGHLAPALAIILGVLASLATSYGIHQQWITAVEAGLYLGLTAGGLYSGSRAVAQQLASRQVAGSSNQPTTPISTPWSQDQ